MRTLPFLASLDFRPHPPCHYQWLLGPAEVPAQLESLYLTCPLQLLTGNAPDSVSTFQGSSAKHGHLGPQRMAFQYPAPMSLLFLPSHAQKVPLVSLVSDPSGLSGLICFSALLIISISSHRAGENSLPQEPPVPLWAQKLALSLVLMPART